SRRRHTRCLSDWSSDVCSSDLDRYALPSHSEPQTRRRTCPYCPGLHSSPRTAETTLIVRLVQNSALTSSRLFVHGPLQRWSSSINRSVPEHRSWSAFPV